VTGKPHDADPDNIPDLLARQVVQPVLWEDLMQGILAGGDNRFFEVGPGKVLAGLLKRIQRKAECLSVPA
jgi:[acyl-carrier-protein] S-malonyltransferase